MASTSQNAASPSNPSNLPSRFQIRRLTPEHAVWAGVIVLHSNVFHSTVFSRVYPDGQGARFNAGMSAVAYLVEHQISSGFSFGVFDLEYKYRQSSSEATGGAFLWDPKDDALTGEQLLAAMDFPLVSVALAYDGIDSLDMARVAPLAACLPVFGTVYAALNERDPRKESWHAKERGQVLMRNATSTRRDYEGLGLMAGLARFLMREAQSKGYQIANIECLSDAVTHVWANPKQNGMRGEVVAEFMTQEYEEKDEEGKVSNPFHPAEQRVTRVCTQLNVQ